jgi:hypothetical protein
MKDLMTCIVRDLRLCRQHATPSRPPLRSRLQNKLSVLLKLKDECRGVDKCGPKWPGRRAKHGFVRERRFSNTFCCNGIRAWARRKRVMIDLTVRHTIRISRATVCLEDWVAHHATVWSKA